MIAAFGESRPIFPAGDALLQEAMAKVASGRYVLAVSGGVDSMVLLDVLARRPDLEVVVAHFDHGIRADSADDRALVRATAAKHGLPFIYELGRLGAQTGEDEARRARYGFLRRVMLAHGAQAIITAHHQDDLLETALLNLARGTGRKGLTSLGNQPELLRPLLDIPKAQVLEYARRQNLGWHEDSTNASERYRRNLVRQRLLPRLSAENRRQFVALLSRQRMVNAEVDALLDELLARQPAPNRLNRLLFAALPYAVAAELLAEWLRRNNLAGFSKKRLHQLVVLAKTAQPGKRSPLSADAMLSIQKQFLHILPTHRTPKPE